MTSKAEAKGVCQEFVKKHVKKTVSVSIAESTVKISPENCSKSLGRFWVEVLQHSQNYPEKDYDYEMLEDSKRIRLKVKGIKVTINLTTGDLMIQGTDSAKWFLDTFAGVMDRYDESPPDSTPDSHIEGNKQPRKKKRK